MATTEMEEFKKQFHELMGSFDRVYLPVLFVKKKDGRLCIETRKLFQVTVKNR